MTSSFSFAPLFPAGLPAPSARWTGLAKYSFVGGNNDSEQVPLDELIEATNTVLRREGRSLATYGLAHGPQGYLPLREFLVTKLKRDAGITCTVDDLLIVSGSLQALDLVNATLLTRGDTVIFEQDSYQGSLNRLTRLGVNVVGIPLDKDGMRMDVLATTLADLKSRGIRPKYIYTIPTVQNPTGSIMPESRRAELVRLATEYGVPIFEDDCYADLVWSGQRPPAIYAMSPNGGVIHIGSFSKSIAPALRVGFVVAPWEVMSRMLSLKTDAGSGALEQMVLATYCKPHFASHVPALTKALRTKLDTLMEALNEQFGTAAEFEEPKGGIFLWVKLPDQVDTLKLYQAALAAGVSINPGPEWSTNKGHSSSRLRCALRAPRISRSATASPCWPRSAARSSACRPAAPMWRSGPEAAASRPDVKLHVDLAAPGGWKIVAKLLGGAAVVIPAQRGEQHDGVGHAAFAVALGGIVRKHVEEFAIAAALPQLEHAQVDLTIELAGDRRPRLGAELLVRPEPVRERPAGEDCDPFIGFIDCAASGFTEDPALLERGEQGRGDRDHLRKTVRVHVVHRHDGAVFEPEAGHLVGGDVETRVCRPARDSLGEARITRQIVAQILDHLRRLVARERAAMPRIGVDVVAEIGEPVGIEHHEAGDAALFRSPAQLAQGADRRLSRGTQRAAGLLRQHQ
ncbi:DNA-binding transcriptional MocR family regulator [Bradyrhizobium liaoningense]